MCTCAAYGLLLVGVKNYWKNKFFVNSLYRVWCNVVLEHHCELCRLCFNYSGWYAQIKTCFS